MLDILHYSFMIRALFAGLLLAVTIPVMGSFLVTRRYSLITDSLAHVSLAGVGAGLLLRSSPILLAIPVTVAGGLLLEYLRQNKQIKGDSSLAILMSGGLAIAVVFANLAHGLRNDFSSYLFGSITTTTPFDLVTLAISCAIVLAVIAINYRAFLHIAFDEDSARVAGYRVKFLNYLLAALTAVIVVLSLRIVGGLLIGALLVIPVVTVSRLTRSFAGTLVSAILVAMLAVLGGLLLAFYAGIAAGGAIVLSALVLLILSFIMAPAN